MPTILPLLLPPLIALALLLTLTYLLLPLYRRRAYYTQYMPADSRLGGIRDWLFDRITSYAPALGPNSFHRRTWSGLSDEEMDDEEMIDPVEGLEVLHEHVGQERRDGNERRGGGINIARGGDGSGERRLSRDLEAGFRDDSEEEEEMQQEERRERTRGGR